MAWTLVIKQRPMTAVLLSCIQAGPINNAVQNDYSALKHIDEDFAIIYCNKEILLC